MILLIETLLSKSGDPENQALFQLGAKIVEGKLALKLSKLDSSSINSSIVEGLVRGTRSRLGDCVLFGGMTLM